MAGKVVTKEHGLAALILGGIEVLFGLIVVICSFVLAGKANMSTTLTPYWAGIAFIVPGIFGIICGFTKNHCIMITFMILNIISFVVEGIGCILIAIVVAIWAVYASEVTKCQYDKAARQCYCEYNGERNIIGDIESCEVLTSISVLLYVLIVFLVLAALVTLASSILGCISVCCTNSQQSDASVPLQKQAPPPYA